MRVFLDANILFSAAKSDGAIRHLLRELRDSGHECIADEYVIAEARRNLEKKFPSTTGNLDALLSGITAYPARKLPDHSGFEKLLPEKDRPVLSAAILAGCDVLVTGDRTHFGTLYGKAFSGVTIHSPASLAELFG